MTPVFITGTGTDVGKTVASVVVANALGAGYWKPVQAGNQESSDREKVQELLEEGLACFPEVYHLALPASPHFAASREGVTISLDVICDRCKEISTRHPELKYLVVEGAGGLLVPLNDHEFVADLIKKLQAKVILVSRNYLGSINHSLLTAAVCRQRNLDVIGWVFNDDYMQFDEAIAGWSGYPLVGRIPKLETVTRQALSHQASLLKSNILHFTESNRSC